MRLKTRQEEANRAAKLWKDQFCKDDKWRHVQTFEGIVTADIIYLKLLNLGRNPKPEDVNAIVYGWANVEECAECGSNVDTVVELGSPPDYKIIR